MRTRQQIEKDPAGYEKLYLEVLLDIRELLVKQNIKRKPSVTVKKERRTVSG